MKDASLIVRAVAAQMDDRGDNSVSITTLKRWHVQLSEALRIIENRAEAIREGQDYGLVSVIGEMIR